MNKKELIRKNIIKNFSVIGLALIILISFVFLVFALTSDESQALQSELDNLTADLNSQGYSWLTDYLIDYPFVEVYRAGDNQSIANFGNIISEGWYKIFLTNLSENESLDVFDLKILGGEGNLSSGFRGVEFDYIVDPSNTIPNQPVLNAPANYSTGISLNPLLSLTVTDPDGGNLNTTFLKTYILISAGTTHSCSILANGSAMCWGAGTNGRLGYGGTTTQPNPVYVNSTNQFIAISASLGSGLTGFGCGIIANGSAMCWGKGTSGQLGDGLLTDSNNSVYVNTTNQFVSISAGAIHSCSILANGSAMCWGSGANGRLGYGGTTNQPNPVYVNSTNQFIAISAGFAHTCGITSNGSAVCWGAGTAGQLGDGLGTSSNNSVYVNTTNQFVSISAGTAHTCSILANRSAMCWGKGTNGQLGDGLGTSSNNSVYVNSTNQFVSISAGGTLATVGYSCGIIANGSAMCWGSGTAGQLGDGLLTDSNNPVYVNSTNTWSSPVIGTSLNIASGSTASVTWSSLTSAMTYLWRAYVSDGSLIINSPIWSFTTGTGDTTFPVVNITYPTNTTHSNYVTALNYTIIETDSDKCWYSNSSGVWNSSVVSAGTNWTGLNSTEGSNTWTVYCNDTTGNMNSTSVTFVVNSVVISLNITYPQNTTYTNYVTALNYTSTGASNCWYGNGSINYTSVSAGTNWTNLNGNSSKGSNTWTLWCNDTANNINSTSVTFVVDNVNPLISYGTGTETDGSNLSRNNIFVNVSSSDSVGNVSTVINFDGSLVSWWRMDDTNGSANSVTDYMGRNNGTALGNAVSTDAGKFGKGEGFDGSGDYVITSQLTPPNGNMTACLWVYPKISNSVMNTLGWGNSYNSPTDDRDIYISSGNKAMFYVYNNAAYTATGTSTISPNVWYFLCGTIDGVSGNSIWVNGIREANLSGGTNGYNSYSTPKLVVGGKFPDANGDFNGSIDDVMIFNRSLSALEIAGLYANTSSKYTAINYTGLSDATHTFKAYTQDLAGNVNATDTRSVTTDTSYPTLNITYPQNITYTNYVTALNYTTNANGNCWYGNGSINYTSVSAGTNWTNLNGNSSKGSNTWTLWCNDSAGNVNSTSVTFVVDNTVGTQTISSPTNTTYTTSSVLFNVSSSEVGTGSIIPNLDGSLVSWWRMDDTNGSANSVSDYMGRNNGTAVSGAVQTDAGKLGKGERFDGVDDYVNVNDNNVLDPASEITVSAWVFWAGSGAIPTGWQWLVTKNSDSIPTTGYHLNHRDANGIEFAVNKTRTPSYASANFQKGNWYHLVGTAKIGDTIKLYVNGSLVSSGNVITAIPSNSQALQFASTAYYASPKFNGSIDDVMIFNRSLTADEITALYNATAINHNSTLSEGSHLLTAYSQDRAGNINNSAVSFSLSLDSTAPNITINYPLNATYSASSYNFNITAVDNIGMSSCWMTLNSGVTNNTMTNTTSVNDYNYTNSSIADGSYTAKFYCNDTNNNVNGSMSVTFSKDSAVPILTIISPTTTQTTSTTIFNISSNEALSWCGLSLDNSANITMTSVNTTYYTLTNSTMTDGSHTFRFSCNDTTGNMNSTNSSFTSDLITVTQCRTLNQTNSVYTLQNSMNTTGTCFTITANNITIDFNGYNITGDKGGADYGVYTNTYDNNTIKNGYIYSFGKGIYLTGAADKSTYNNITNMTLNSNTNGIYMDQSTNNFLTNIITNSNTIYGIYFEGSYNNLDTITANSNGYGLYLSSAGYSNITNINIWNCTTDCIFINVASNNNFTSGIINKSAGNLIELQASAGSGNAWNNTFKDLQLLNSVSNSVITSYNGPPSSPGTTSKNIFLNVSYTDAESVYSGHDLTRKWYYTAYVNDTSGTAVSNANVTAYNVTGTYQFNLTTDSNGLTGIANIIDYINTGGTKTYYSPYNIYALNSTYPSLNSSWNVTLKNNTRQDFTLDNDYPLISYGTGTETNASTITRNNIYVNVSVTEANENTIVFNLYYSNGTLVNSSSYTNQQRTINWTGLSDNTYKFNVTVNDTVNKVNSTATRTVTLDLTTITNCRSLNQTGTTYTLQNSLTTTGDCLVISANNITVGMNGYNITGDNNSQSDYGIDNSGDYNYTNVKNGAIYNFGRGVNNDAGNNGNFTNLTISSSGNFGGDSSIKGIYVTSNNYMKDINVVNLNNSGTGVVSAYGIHIAGNSNILTNIVTNSIQASGTGGTAYGIYILSNSNNISDSNFSNSKTNDVYLIVGTNNIFLNASYSSEIVGAGCSLIRKWYYTAYVNDTAGANVSGANITAYNVTGTYQFNLTTGTDGLTTSTAQIIDYVNNAGTKTYYSLYNIYAGNTTYPTMLNTWNVTAQQNTRHTISLDNVYPIINMTYPTNTTYGINVSAINYTYTEINCDKVWYSTNNGVTNSSAVSCGTNFTSVSSSEGSNTWKVYINDTANNLNSTSITFTKDTTTPLITITSPLNQTYNTNSILINFTADSYSNLWYYNGTSNRSYTSSETITASQGSNAFIFYANDTAGNLNSTSLTFFVDNVYPLISFGTGTSDDYSNVSRSNVYVNTSWTEINLANITFSLYNGTNGNVVNQTTYTTAVYLINWTGLVDNNYTYEVNITDTANNKNSTGIRNIRLDTTKPLISYANDTLADLSRVWNTNVYVNVSLTETNFKNITFNLYYSNNTAVNTTTYTTGIYNINWTSLAGDDYKYNISVYDTAGNTNSTTTRTITLITSQDNLTLNSGWNLISLPMKNTDTGTDRNISLVAGWNLIGYTGAINTSLANAVFNNGSNSYTWAQALANNKVQAYLSYYDNNAQDNLTQFKYLSTISDMDDTMFRQNKGYWVYANSSGNLTIPSIGGTTSGQNYSWGKLRFMNSSGSEKNVSDAISNSWVMSGTGAQSYVNQYNPTSKAFEEVSDGDEAITNLFTSYRGYFIHSNQDNITLIRQN